MSQHEPTDQSAIDDGAQSLLVERKSRLGPMIVLSVLGAGALLLLSAPFWLPNGDGRNMAGADDDRYLSSPPQGEPYLTPPPPQAPQATVVQPSPAPVPSSDDTEARRRAEEARRRADEEAKRRAEEEAALETQRWQRYRSPMVVTEMGQPDAPQPPKAEDTKGKAEGALQETNPNSQFLSARASASADVSKAERTPRIDALVPQGTMIRAVLETAVNTDLPGMVRASTTEDVWSFDGRRVLIPSGTRLVGEYNAGVQQNQSRAFIVWTRLIRADGISVNLGSIGTDELGRSGMDGDVDNHYFAKYGPALLVSVLSGAAQAIGMSQSNLNNGPITTTYIDPRTGIARTVTSNSGGQSNQMLAQGAQAVAQGFAQTAQEVLKSTQAIQPTIMINQGTPVSIFVRRDLDFSPFYPDPVMEAYRALKRGRKP
ncbi:type IV secretion system protein VirB10 [Labrys portucalensis]|uniref:Type IV secretion system protein VirB10 n=1 Tax=Labrys neptuniae TaxID=376174 RepID=A0ABV6ZQP6_9HYPH